MGDAVGARRRWVIAGGIAAALLVGLAIARYAVQSRYDPIIHTIASFPASSSTVRAFDGSMLEGRRYVSKAVTVKGANRPLVADTELSLTFRHGGVGWIAGCNGSFSETFQLVDGQLELRGDISHTEVRCSEDKMAQERWYEGIVTARPQLSFEGKTLTLTSGETVIVFVDEPSEIGTWKATTTSSSSTTITMPDVTVVSTTQATAPTPTSTTSPSLGSVPTTIVPAPSVYASDLSGHTYKSTLAFEFGAERPLMYPSGFAALYMDFDEPAADSVQVFGGCNRTTAGYTVEGAELVLGGERPPVIPCMATPDEIKNQEAWYFNVLRSRPTLVIDGNQLIMFAGVTVIVFERTS